VDSKYAIAPEPKKIINRALQSHSLVVRLFGYSGEEKTMIFNIEGLQEELDRFPEIAKSLSEEEKPRKKNKR